MGLTPRHQKQFQKKDWAYLDTYIKANIDNSNLPHPSVAVELDQFEMSKEEIIQELKRNGYQVTDEHTGFLRVS